MQSFVFATDCERVREFECAVRKLAHYLRDFEVRAYCSLYTSLIYQIKEVYHHHIYVPMHSYLTDAGGAPLSVPKRGSWHTPAAGRRVHHHQQPSPAVGHVCSNPPRTQQERHLLLSHRYGCVPRLGLSRGPSSISLDPRLSPSHDVIVISSFTYIHCY